MHPFNTMEAHSESLIKGHDLLLQIWRHSGQNYSDFDFTYVI